MIVLICVVVVLSVCIWGGGGGGRGDKEALFNLWLTYGSRDLLLSSLLVMVDHSN